MESWLNLVARSGESVSHVTSRVDVRAFSFLVLASVNGGEGRNDVLYLSTLIFSML